MTEKDFKYLIAAYGGLSKRWPEDMREKARAYAKTSKGKALLAAIAPIDDALALGAIPKPADAAFLNRLLALPESNMATSKAKAFALQPSVLGRLRQQMPEIAGWLRPSALVAQGMAFSLILIMGIWVGDKEALAQESGTETDLSYSLLNQDITLGENIILEQDKEVLNEE